MRPLEICKGDRFGHLVVIREVDKHGQYRAFELLCDCGTVCEVRLNHLRRSQNPVRSCSCQQKKGNHRTHGRTGSVEYKVWLGMRKRCENLNDKRSYPNYGGRGIKVCERWQTFENFLADMGERPSDKHELDRIDNDGDYEPGNVRWATDSEQMRNRRKLSGGTSQYRGVDLNRGRWRARITLADQVLQIGMFDTEEAAARAYDDAAALHGFRLNFPEGS